MLFLMTGISLLEVAGQSSGKTEGGERWKLRELPALVSFVRAEESEGFSAAYGGIIGGIPIVAGGCNFPERPAAEGGPKRYYKEIYALRGGLNPEGKWEKVGDLPVEAACGVSVTLSEGVVCIGGRNEVSSLRHVWLLTWNQDQSAVLVKELPALPVGMDNMGGGSDGKSIFVAGGNTEGQPVNRCFVLESCEQAEWKELPAFPGPARVQPVGAVQSVAGKRRFYLMGGFQPGNEQTESVVSTDGVYWDAGDQKWHLLAEMVPEGETEAFSLIGASGVAWGKNFILVQGGVNRRIFKAAIDNAYLQGVVQQQEKLKDLREAQATYMQHAPEWYRFNSRLFLYHVATDSWKVVGQWPEIARAGAVFMCEGGRLVVVNGETKPGIRSAGVYLIESCGYKNK